MARQPADEVLHMEAALEEERELSEERWSYQKVAAEEMRKAGLYLSARPPFVHALTSGFCTAAGPRPCAVATARPRRGLCPLVCTPCFLYEGSSRIAEEKTAIRQREFDEYQSKRRSGEIQDETTEVVDTLRWPSAQQDLAGVMCV